MSIKVGIEGSASGAVKAVNDLNAAISKTEKGAQLTAKEMKQLERAAGQVVKANEGPQERYNRRIGELGKLVESGKLKMVDAEKAAMRFGMQLDNTGKAGERAFGPGALAMLTRYAGGIFSITAAVSSVTRAFQRAHEVAKAAAQQDIGSRGGLAMLMQLAATADDPDAAGAAMMAEARAMFATGVSKSEDEAGKQLFAMFSADFTEQDRDFAKRIQRHGVVADVGGAASAHKAMITALGREEVGSFESTLDKALAVSRVAPAKMEEIIQAAAGAGGSAKELKLSDEFIFSATAIAASQTGSASTGGTQIAAFLKSIESTGIAAMPELKGMSGVELVEAIKAKNLDRAGLEKILGGRDEAIKGFRVLADNLEGDDGLRTLVREAYAAQQKGLARTAIRLTDTDPRMRAALEAETDAQSLLAVRAELHGRKRNLAQRVQDQRTAFKEQHGTGPVGMWLDEFIFNRRTDQSVLESVANPRNRPQVEMQYSEDLLEEVRDFLREQTEIMRTGREGGRLPVASGRQE